MLETKRLTFTSLLISIALILSKCKISFFINGGSITLFSMLPLITISFVYGYKWGLFSGSIFGLLHFITTNTTFKGFNLATICFSIFLDYIIAFSFIGCASFFTLYKINNFNVKLLIAIVISFFLKFLTHVLSGVLIWNTALHSIGASLISSIVYNLIYNVPEMLITLVGFLLLNKLQPQFTKKLMIKQ